MIQLVVHKMKDEEDDVTIEEFLGLKPKMYFFFVNDSSEHKKAKGVNKNIVATLRLNDYKRVLLNNKCLRHSMNRIESKNHRIGSYEINKILLSWFDDKIHSLKNRYDGLALGC